MVKVVYKGVFIIKAPTEIEYFRCSFKNEKSITKKEYVGSWASFLFGKEYDETISICQGNIPFYTKEYEAFRTLWGKYETLANNEDILEKEDIKNADEDKWNFNTLNYIFKNRLKTKDYTIEIISSPDATEEEKAEMEKIIY